MSGRAAAGRVLPARDAYRLWASSYDAETAVSALDEIAVRRLSPPLAGKALLDVGCGTGRRLRSPARAADAPGRPGPETGPIRRVGVDLVYEMLSAGRRAGMSGAPLVNADARALPLANARFDVVWCRLVVGHVAELEAIYRELARVGRSGARVIVTDFHPDAVHAGHTRTFRDGGGRIHAVEHFVHDVAAHGPAAAAAGLVPAGRYDARVGAAVRPYYEAAGALDRYAEQRGLALVAALAFTRPHSPAPRSGRER